MRRLLVRLGLGVAGLVVASTTASAHGGLGHGGATTTLAVVVGLPIVAGFGGGVTAIRYRSARRPEPGGRNSSIAIGLLLIGLGAASLLSAATGHHWLSVAGGTIGAAFALWYAGGGTVPEIGCGSHAELTLGVVSTHRLLEGVVLGTLYSAGAAVGLLGALVLAVHAALETAVVGGLYVTAPRRTRAVGAIVLVQAGHVVGVVAGLGTAGAMPVPVRTLAFGIVGGALVVVGANETKHSFAVARTAELP